MTDHKDPDWSKEAVLLVNKCREQQDALEALQLERNTAHMDGYEGGKQEARDAAHAEIDQLRAEVDRLIAEKKAAAMNYEAQIDWLNGDKEVLLGHMDTINRCSNDPAIFNLSKVVIERFAAGAAPTRPTTRHEKIVNPGVYVTQAAPKTDTELINRGCRYETELTQAAPKDDLDWITPEAVFEAKLNAHGIPNAQAAPTKEQT